MGTSWLANAHHENFWPHLSWPEFDALSADAKKRVTIVLPVHGFADHGLGLPLDAEEIAGSEILKRAAAQCDSLLVLPPLRFGLAPYPSARFGIDAETAHEQMCEIAKSVKAAGFARIVFFNTSPWNEELVATVALDTRVSLGLENHIVQLSKLGMSFHPGAPREARANAQSATAFVLGLDAEKIRANINLSPKSDVRDADFRPGNFQQPETLAPNESLDGETITNAAAAQLIRLLAEITQTAQPVIGQADASACAIFPANYRKHYLPALTAGELAALPDKAHSLVIISTGAIEQHGPHLPVGVDAILGQALLANTLPKISPKTAARVFVAPPVTFGKSNEHDGFPGTITITAQTLRRVLLATAADLREQGFRCIAILNTHGGNSPVIVSTLREIQTTLGMRTGMIKAPLSSDLSEKEAALGIHAGQWETALMLASAPELVRMDKAVCEYPARPLEGFAWVTRDISQSGVMGDATAATPEQGTAWMETASRELAERITALLQ